MHTLAKLWIAPGRQIVSANAEAEGLLGYDEASLRGQLVSFIFPRRLRDDIERFLQRYQAEPTAIDDLSFGTLAVRTRTGKEEAVLLGLEPIAQEDGLWIALTLRAVTDVEGLEEPPQTGGDDAHP
jgi:PAS domain S-box-containing protein